MWRGHAVKSNQLHGRLRITPSHQLWLGLHCLVWSSRGLTFGGHGSHRQAHSLWPGHPAGIPRWVDLDSCGQHSFSPCPPGGSGQVPRGTRLGPVLGWPISECRGLYLWLLLGFQRILTSRGGASPPSPLLGTRCSFAFLRRRSTAALNPANSSSMREGSGVTTNVP